MGRRIPIVERRECGVCRRPIDVGTMGQSVIVFEPGSGRVIHRCPEQALESWDRLMRMAGMGDPKAREKIEGAAK